eukprot:CAMPEP_0201501914 /NCGR_PEP_ID=MMETSP0151_2-20130828/83851_1 /ASSEMBLY_ACC=CAM_ASM_000257 /TAXON_ID=200890 /ORGANISM="Paramoeba atlantica, Strain 621/1 / CCAP 1560/9" /LENGTH=129 /DNA_ID=CAMNT_0047895465 /DNA_START=922 /DNA_END=1311 /DNA_ORIENTATION=+
MMEVRKEEKEKIVKERSEKGEMERLKKEKEKEKEKEKIVKGRSEKGEIEGEDCEGDDGGEGSFSDGEERINRRIFLFLVELIFFQRMKDLKTLSALPLKTNSAVRTPKFSLFLITKLTTTIFSTISSFK